MGATKVVVVIELEDTCGDCHRGMVGCTWNKTLSNEGRRDVDVAFEDIGLLYR
jgi:hypothetical protein